MRREVQSMNYVQIGHGVVTALLVIGFGFAIDEGPRTATRHTAEISALQETVAEIKSELRDIREHAAHPETLAKVDALDNLVVGISRVVDRRLDRLEDKVDR